QYCVSLALIQGGVPTLGVLGCPNLSPKPAPGGDEPYPAAEVASTYWAIHGEGAMMSFDSPAATIETNLERGDVAEGEPARLAEAVVTDALGRPLDFSRGRGREGNVGIVGAPPELHARLMRGLERFGVGRG